jgi:hypothetical protein
VSARIVAGRQIPMILAFLQRPIRFASGVFAYALLATIVGPTQAETTTRLDAIVGGGTLRVGLDRGLPSRLVRCGFRQGRRHRRRHGDEPCAIARREVGNCKDELVDPQIRFADEQLRHRDGWDHHHLLFGFGKAHSSAAIAEVIRRFAELKALVPGIDDFEWGENSSAEGLNHGHSHVFLLTFANAQAPDAYLVHPDHAAFANLGPAIVSSVTVLDYWIERTPN